MGTIRKIASLIAFLLFFPATVLGLDQEKEQNQDLDQEVKDLKKRIEVLEEIVKKDESEPGWRVIYKRGLNFENADGSFSAKISGKIHIDSPDKIDRVAELVERLRRTPKVEMCYLRDLNRFGRLLREFGVRCCDA